MSLHLILFDITEPHFGRSRDELRHTLWSDAVRRGCDQSERTQFRRNEVTQHEVRWDEMDDMNAGVEREVSALINKSTRDW